MCPRMEIELSVFSCGARVEGPQGIKTERHSLGLVGYPLYSLTSTLSSISGCGMGLLLTRGVANRLFPTESSN